MYLKKCHQQKNGKGYDYYQVVESYWTERGPRQRVVAHIGNVPETVARGVEKAARGKNQKEEAELFERPEAEWVEVNVRQVWVERVRDFGGVWLGYELARRIGLVEFLVERIPEGREEIPWSVMVLILVLFRFAHPSSELAIAERLYGESSLADLLGIPESKINDDRLYRALDQLLPQKPALEGYLKEKLGTLFSLDYEVLFYDVTSTYFEGVGEKNDLAQRGYSRDHREDCKQVCIGLVVSREGIPLGYEVFAGNRTDVTTVEEMVEKIEAQYGKAQRIWVMDRGMVSQENIEFMKEGNRRYILGTSKSQLKRYERELLSQDWQGVREGVEVKLCPSPEGDEMFILCRSQRRQEKEKAIHDRFEKRMEEGLKKLQEHSQKRKLNSFILGQRVGRLREKNSRISGLFETTIQTQKDGSSTLTWSKKDAWREWAQLCEGVYLLRTNILDWSSEELWKTYIQLTEAEEAFRIQKSELSLRPIWHQREDRVQAHILVCFLAYVLYKTLSLMSQKAGLGNSPKKILDEIRTIRLVDVVLPTKKGINIVRRCVSRPTKVQSILLDRLGLTIPEILTDFKTDLV